MDGPQGLTSFIGIQTTKEPLPICAQLHTFKRPVHFHDHVEVGQSKLLRTLPQLAAGISTGGIYAIDKVDAVQILV